MRRERLAAWALASLIALVAVLVFAASTRAEPTPSPVVLRILGEGGEVYEFTKKDVKHFHAWWAAWMEGVE